jgi:nitrate reductase NapAB chaperone NapD
MDISSVIVESLPAVKDNILKQMHNMPCVDVQASTPQGKIIAVIEAPDVDTAMEIHKSLWELPGVAGVQLAYHYFGEKDHKEERR